jgi:hypothetical protein
MHIATDLWTWIGALLTLFMFSFLFGDNPLYKFGEHIYVGVSVGYFIAITWHNFLYPDLFVPLFKQGNLLYIIPTLLGILYFSIFFPKLSWLIRIPMGFVLGYGAGVGIPAILQANIIKQIQGSLLTSQILKRWDLTLWYFISLFGIICTIVYFFFSRERKGISKPAAEAGIVFLMVGFGASFGYTVMARISLLIGRLQFLLGNWLGIIH